MNENCHLWNVQNSYYIFSKFVFVSFRKKKLIKSMEKYTHIYTCNDYWYIKFLTFISTLKFNIVKRYIYYNLYANFKYSRF